MQTRIQLVTIIGAAVILLTVLEMVRRRRLMERYALLWVFSAGVLLALAIWSGALAKISHTIGVIYPPNALFYIAIGCIVLPPTAQETVVRETYQQAPRTTNNPTTQTLLNHQ